MQEISVIHAPSEEKPFAVIYKPAGLPSAPLSESDEQTALSQALRLFPAVNAVCGVKPVERGLLHRLDTATSGLLLVAADQRFYDFMLSEQKEGRFIKEYAAKCHHIKENARFLGGFPAIPAQVQSLSLGLGAKAEVNSFFRSFGVGKKEVRPVTEASSPLILKKIGAKKLYRTSVWIKDFHDGVFSVSARIQEGFRHQVRCHLAWCGFPVLGDTLYNYKVRERSGEEALSFAAVSLSFMNPLTCNEERFSIDAPF